MNGRVLAGAALLLVGCVSDEALSQVDIGMRLPARSCQLVSPGETVRGEDRDRAEDGARKRAAHRSANFVLVKAEQKRWSFAAYETMRWTGGRAWEVHADLYLCDARR